MHILKARMRYILAMSDIVKALPSNCDLASGNPSFRNLAALWRSNRGA
jgi:hypothetical protein